MTGTALPPSPKKTERKRHLAGLDLLLQRLDPGLKFGRGGCQCRSCRLSLTLQLGCAGCQGSLRLGALGYGLVLQVSTVLSCGVGARLGLSCCNCKPNQSCVWIQGGDAAGHFDMVGAMWQAGTLAREGVM